MKDFLKATNSTDGAPVKGLFKDGMYIYGYRYVGELWLATRWYAADGTAVNRAARCDLWLDVVELEVGKFYQVKEPVKAYHLGMPPIVRIKEKKLNVDKWVFRDEAGSVYHLDGYRPGPDSQSLSLLREVSKQAYDESIQNA